MSLPLLSWSVSFASEWRFPGELVSAPAKEEEQLSLQRLLCRAKWQCHKEAVVPPSGLAWGSLSPGGHSSPVYCVLGTWWGKFWSPSTVHGWSMEWGPHHAPVLSLKCAGITSLYYRIQLWIFILREKMYGSFPFYNILRLLCLHCTLIIL